MIEPDCILTFKVPWINKDGQVIVNTGYRVHFSNLIGPYKGGIRFSSTVNLSILKLLAFEQTFKNSLTGLPLGGAKGGSDFDPRGKTDFEIMTFCQNFMLELSKHIGSGIDVPAGDLGVGQREIGYLYGMYKKISDRHDETLTGKAPSYGGSLVRPEATGYGLAYIVNKALETYYQTTFDKKNVIISGAGQVASHAAIKVTQLGGKVIAMSTIDGVIHDQKGIDIPLLTQLAQNNSSLELYLDSHPTAIFSNDPKSLWKIKTDIALPCATQNEIDHHDVIHLIKNGLMLLGEGANKPLTNEAIALLKEKNIVFIPAKAANAGGVATSSFEMSQNVTNSFWSFETVDNKLKDIMETIFSNIYSTALQINETYNLEKAANIAAFHKLYLAMKAQGI